MSIVYSLISRGTTVFCEHTGERGNFQQVTRTILEKIDAAEDAKHSYSYDDYTFHMIVEQGIIYLAMSSKDLERKTAFAFLEQTKHQFDDRYQDIFATAVAFEMNKTFAKTLVDNMHRYNSGNAAGAAGGGEEAGARAAGHHFTEAGGADAKIRKVKGEIEEVKQVMTDNIDRILDRGDKIDLLVDKSLDLSEQASKFQKSSKQLQRSMWWKNAKLQAIVGCCILTAAVVIALTSTRCFGAC